MITRKIVASVSMAVFGSLAVLGYALHGLPGLNHFGGCSCAYHTAGPLPPVSCVTTPTLRADQDQHSEHDCPLCSFFALAKHVAADPPQVVVGEAADLLAPAEYAFLADDVCAPYAARGPPVTARFSA